MALLTQAALLFASFLFLLVVVLLVARYFLLHARTALRSAAHLLAPESPAGAVEPGGMNACGMTAAAGGGMGAAAGAMTVNVSLAVVGWVCPPWPWPEGVVVAWRA